MLPKSDRGGEGFMRDGFPFSFSPPLLLRSRTRQNRTLRKRGNSPFFPLPPFRPVFLSFPVVCRRKAIATYGRRAYARSNARARSTARKRGFPPPPSFLPLFFFFQCLNCSRRGGVFKRSREWIPKMSGCNINGFLLLLFSLLLHGERRGRRLFRRLKEEE